MSSKRAYAGAARFMEIAPPGIPFRAFVNIDHVTSITFGNKIEDVDVSEEGEDEHMERRVTGFQVIVTVGGQQNEFTFARAELAIDYYADLLQMIGDLGVPCCVKSAIQPPPPEESPIVDSNGEQIVAEDDLEILLDEIAEDNKAANAEEEDPTIQ